MQYAWIVVVTACACTNKADPPIEEKKPDPVEKTAPRPTKPAGPTEPKPVDRKPHGKGEPFLGFFRVASMAVDGENTNIDEGMRKSWKGDAADELDFVRMSLEFEADRLTVGMEMTVGEPGEASFCTAHASTDLVVKDGKFTLPKIKGTAAAGSVRVNGSDTKRASTNCNASFGGGTFSIKDNGKTVLLSAKLEGKQFSLDLVAEEKEIDLQARAEAFAKKR